MPDSRTVPTIPSVAGRSLRTLITVALVWPLLHAQITSVSADDQKDRFALPATNDGLPGKGPVRRYPWFRNLWQKRRAAFASERTAKQRAVVLLGDSITQGWGNQPDREFSGLTIANRGISGDTTRGMLIRMDEDVLALNPVAVVLLAGTNDLEEGASPETIAGNMRLILDRIHRHNPDVPVVLCLVFPSSATKKRPAALIRKINELYIKVASQFPQVTVLDTYTLFADENGDAKIEEFPDLLHPNNIGYQKWAKALRPVLATLQLIETEPDAFSPEPGFRPLFNGKDLTGWEYRPTSEKMKRARERWHARDPNAPPWPVITTRTSFDGKVQTHDGRYRVINGRLVVTTPQEGRKIQQLWTTEEFPDDFVLKLEFRATPNADSGVFIREPQLQCRDYVLAGPWKNLTKYRPQQWNELVIEVTGNKARCTCNGELLDDDFSVPATGPIGLEGDRGQMEYRRIRIRTVAGQN